MELSAQLRTLEQQLIDQETDFESQVLIFEDKAKEFKDQNQKLAAEISQIKQVALNPYSYILYTLVNFFYYTGKRSSSTTNS